VDDELPRQWLDESVEPPLRVVELGGQGDPDEAFQAYTEEVFASPMPLGDHPLFRIELIRAGENLSYLLWRFHHLIADWTSVSITLSHWFSAYDALSSGTMGELAPPSSYLKTISSDAAYLESAAYHKDLAYWSNRFDPLPEPLIADMEPRAHSERKVPAMKWTFTGAEFAEFQQAAAAAKTSVQRALFALFAVTLGRRYGQSDVVTGVALHRRDLSSRHTLGMLSGVIPVRCAFDPFWSLTECVQAFSEQMDRDLRHQRLPVDILSRALGLSGTGRAGLFEAALSFLPAEQGSGLDGLPVVTGIVSTKEASPISLHASEMPGGAGVTITIAVNPDFVEPMEAGTLSVLFRAALERFSHEPELQAADLHPVSRAERHLVVEGWNATATQFDEGTLDSLFSAQVRRTPQAVAVVGRDGVSLTYAELETRSTQLAGWLVERGVGPELVVGVRMERSAETIIAFLGILKAGGVYLPLDPGYPADRLDFMAADAGAILVLDSLPEGPRADVRISVDANPQRLAYIIYTSGTTGLPKGVAVSHAAPVNMAFARRACHDPLGPGDRVLAAISVSFDVSIGQLLLPLLSGATVVIAGDVKTMGAAEFWALLARERVTHINSVPSFLDSILDAVPVGGSLSLKRLMLGGEALSGALVGRIQGALPGMEVVNMYGPTEACIDATYHVAREADLTAPVLPIGRPLSNYQAYVLDSGLEPAGIGVTGELYLGGAGLARGYLNAPDLTAERFVADPFSGVAGARLYRTGDRARWRADGRIEFLGRVDKQVKIRGFRVEPGEIVATLLGHPDVAQAVVVSKRNRLVAYVVPPGGQPVPETADLRDYLAARLPDYMVPSAFVAIAEIPLNSNGKLDEQALPSPDLREGEYVSPRTPTEETLSSLFAEVLGLERCGATDHFFELGGHSLLATSLVSKLRGLGMNLPLRAVFETPMVEALARRIDHSLPVTASARPITPRARPEDIPLSFPQERIWFVDRLQQDSSYNIPIVFELHGHLNIEAARHAMERIVARHEALRTRIVLKNGRPIQEIAEAAPVALRQTAMSAEALRRLMRHEFDLAVDAPFALELMKVADDRHVLAAVIHHVAFDGWSAGIFLREFAECYAAFLDQRPDRLEALPLQYADFAFWQREQTWDADLAYWLEELDGAPARLDLPVGEFVASEVGRSAGTLPFQVDAALHAVLLKLARESGASLFMVLHAAFALLLSRWSGQDDVVIGTVTANRGHAELEPLIGCFVNTLALRTKLETGEAFTQLLARVKSSDLAAYAHQDLPFEQLVEALHPERSLQHTPVFQVMLVLQNTPVPVMQLPGLRLEPMTVEAETAKFDLTLSLAEQDGGLSGTMEYAANRFDAASMERLAKQFRRVLEAVAADAQQDYSRIDVLEPAERELVVSGWNRTQTAFAKGTLDGLFSAQARRTPDAMAVVGRDGLELTYAELDARSTQLAGYLVGQGIGPEAVVGVRMERSADTIIAFLGILKAGGVYLPLDPAYPADRLEYMAVDAGAKLILDHIPQAKPAEFSISEDPNRLAYIIYTSGTTGLPKGVAVSHVAPVNMAFARRACHDPLGPGDRVLAAISVGFDVSIGQLLLPLLSGATVVIAGDLKTMGAAEFWALLATQRVTHINSVPSFLDSILDAAPTAGALPLKRLMLGGEALNGALVGRIKRVLPGVEVVNMYGPTEACIDATYHVASDADLSAAVLPIGRPLSNYQAYVLDHRLEPVGVGIAGELYLGGTGLARGYVHAPELTAERFVADPFSDVAGARLYRTGDRARWRADGRLEFLGRADQQVKIRGFRVEPGEIEAQLRRQPGIREAAVIVESGRLLAYYTGETASLDTLRAVLPDYMVPSALIHLDRLPLSANGKLDRKALPLPPQIEFEAPVGETEIQMAALWAELLKLDRVGRQDNFFELGGHSLLAITLMERMQQQGLPGDIRALFASPTIAGLAASGAGRQATAPLNGIPPECDAITPEMLPLVHLTQAQVNRIVAGVPGGASNVQDIYPLAPLQEGILFQHLMAPGADPYVAPFELGFESRERLDGFLAALQTLVERHDVLRTAMVWKDVDEPLQLVLRHVDVPVEEVAGPVDASNCGLDLSQAPLLRVVVTNDGGRWRLLMLTHHLILDHTSMDVVVGELRALMANPPLVLPAAPPYRNFIAETRAGATRQEHQAFFTQLLGDVEEPTAPFGLVDIQSNNGPEEEATLALDMDLSGRIREQCRALGVTPASLFHLAWAAVLGHISGREDVVFGTVLFGRMRSGAGASRAVGMFINTLPIRLKLDETGAAESVVRTHQVLSELMAHEHASLALAQRCSAVPASAPLFSSLFNYRHNNAEGPESVWPGVEMLSASERTNYPLAMAVDDASSSFTLTALGQSAAHPARVCAYLRQAVKGLADLLERYPATPISALPVLPRAERRLVLEQWNRTDRTFETGTLDGLFSAQARRTPDAVAVAGRDGALLTYAELDAKSTELARYLAGRGVKPERVVGVRMERSAETIVAFLGVLKAGGVYLPLDPAYPAERLDFMASDAGAVLVLDSIPSEPLAELRRFSDAQRLAYIIYTSGTTGLPKGVAVSHAAPVNMAFARRACHDPLGPGDRVLAAISVGFDVSIGQLLLPLLSGATVVIAGDLKTMGAAEFWTLLARERVTHINSVPSFLDSILDAAPAAGQMETKRLMLGGEALSGALVARIRRALPGVEVVNMYGPTETCIDATYYVADGAGDLAAAVLPIGVPLSNYQAYVLDSRMEPVAIGVAGELYRT
jgi:amino acid adenylation domain-containing protein